MSVSTLKNSSVSDVVEMVKKEYVKSGEDKKNYLIDVLNCEYADVFIDYVDAFYRVSRCSLRSAENGHHLAHCIFTDFRIKELNMYISDLYDAMSCCTDGDYDVLFYLLGDVGFDYNNDFSQLPQIVYMNDITFDSWSVTDMCTAVDGIVSGVYLYLSGKGKDKMMLSYFPKSETEVQILKSKNFMTVGNSGLMLKICSRDNLPLREDSDI